MSQQQLADASGVNVMTIRKLENGTRHMTNFQTILPLARVLGKEIFILAGMTEQDFEMFK